jgi:hypothetical protein
MDNAYKVGTFINAKEHPETKLVITQYLKRIYYCEAVSDPSHKLLAYFERQLVPPADNKK